ncbi:hypothetical protein OBA40_09655 [Alphaproteobacteria bacterium]|nr:hypothetical protein [Alphaproteobacteria bacterium]
MNIISFTHCSASKTKTNNLSIIDLDDFEFLKELSSEWVKSVNKTTPLCLGRNLYNGVGFRKLFKSLGDENFFIISAGLGLINSTDNIPSYKCTVAEGKKGSIGNHLKEKLDVKEWWNYLVNTKYSRGLIYENINEYDLILFSLTSDYLRMVSEDLNKITKKFYIFTGNKDLAIKLGFEKNLMPYTEVFDGPDGNLRGTNRDFPQRTHVDFLNRLKKYNNFNEAYQSVEIDMKQWSAPIKHNNAKKTDEEILKLIQFHENKYAKVSELLHFFRHELKVACEEKRFKTLYRNFKEDHKCLIH